MNGSRSHEVPSTMAGWEDHHDMRVMTVCVCDFVRALVRVWFASDILSIELLW